MLLSFSIGTFLTNHDVICKNLQMYLIHSSVQKRRQNMSMETITTNDLFSLFVSCNHGNIKLKFASHFMFVLNCVTVFAFLFPIHKFFILPFLKSERVHSILDWLILKNFPGQIKRVDIQKTNRSGIWDSGASRSTTAWGEPTSRKVRCWSSTWKLPTEDQHEEL